VGKSPSLCTYSPQLQQEQRRKSIKRWRCEVWLWKQHLSILSVQSYFPELGQKQVARRRYLGNCLVQWMLLLTEALAKTLAERESCLLWGERIAFCATSMSIAPGTLLHWERLSRAGPSFSSLTGAGGCCLLPGQPLTILSSPALWVGNSSSQLPLPCHRSPNLYRVSILSASCLWLLPALSASMAC